jgi:hypothetical protein
MITASPAWDPEAMPADWEAGRRRYYTINWTQFVTTCAAFALFLVALISLQAGPQPDGRRKRVPARLGTSTHLGHISEAAPDRALCVRVDKVTARRRLPFTAARNVDT